VARSTLRAEGGGRRTEEGQREPRRVPSHHPNGFVAARQQFGSEADEAAADAKNNPLESLFKGLKSVIRNTNTIFRASSGAAPSDGEADLTRRDQLRSHRSNPTSPAPAAVMGATERLDYLSPSVHRDAPRPQRDKPPKPPTADRQGTAESAVDITPTPASPEPPRPAPALHPRVPTPTDRGGAGRQREAARPSTISNTSASTEPAPTVAAGKTLVAGGRAASAAVYVGRGVKSSKQPVGGAVGPSSSGDDEPDGI